MLQPIESGQAVLKSHVEEEDAKYQEVLQKKRRAKKEKQRIEG